MILSLFKEKEMARHRRITEGRYRLNSRYFGSVKMTKEEIKKILSENKEILKRYKVKSIALFGSYVKNEQTEDSDIDFLVEFEEDTYNNFVNLIFALENLFKKEVTVVSIEDLSPYIRPYVLKEVEKIEG